METENHDPDFVELVLTAGIYVLSRWYRRLILGIIVALIAVNQTIQLLQSFDAIGKR